MGSTSSTSVVSAVSAAHEALRRERELKSEEKVMLVIGSKNLLIEKLIELYKEDTDGDNIETDFISSKFQTGPYIFNELTPRSLSLHATCNFKHLCLFDVYDATYSYNTSDNLVDVVMIENKKNDEQYINYRLLFDGYFREFISHLNNIDMIDIPKDIGNLIESFYDTPFINNYKVDIKSTIFDFWQLDIESKQYFSWCYKRAVCIIYVADLSVYDEIDIATKRNKLSDSIALFYDVVSSLRYIHMYLHLYTYIIISYHIICIFI